MKITSKGQVTIPIEIREELGLLPHTEVAFEIVDDWVRMRKVETSDRRGRRILEHLRGRADSGMTTEEILALTRDDVASTRDDVASTRDDVASTRDDDAPTGGDDN